MWLDGVYEAHGEIALHEKKASSQRSKMIDQAKIFHESRPDPAVDRYGHSPHKPSQPLLAVVSECEIVVVEVLRQRSMLWLRSRAAVTASLEEIQSFSNEQYQVFGTSEERRNQFRSENVPVSPERGSRGLFIDQVDEELFVWVW